MRLVQLRYFKKVAELQNISRSSIELKIPQPVLSKTIKQLEDELGISLFDRTENSIILNENGMIFLNYVNKIINTLDHLKAELDEYNYLENHTVIFYIKSLTYLVPSIISNFKLKHPNIKLKLIRLTSIDNAMKDSDCDIIIYSSPYKDERVNSKCIFKEKYKIAVSKNHRLAKKKIVSLNDLAGENFTYTYGGQSSIDFINELCEKKGFIPRIAFEHSLPEVVRQTIASTDIIGFVPEYVYTYRIDPNIVMLDLWDEDFFQYVYIVWKDYDFIPRSVTLLKNYIIDYFSNGPMVP